MVKPVLYHSSYCANSKRLLDNIREHFDMDTITFLDVSRQRGKPSWVSKIPILSVDGPIHGQTFVGDKLFDLFKPPPVQTQAQASGQQQAEPELDEHDPRARLNGMGTMSTMNKQEATIPMRSSMSDTGGGFQTDLSAYNEASLSNFSSDKALGALSEGLNDQIDFNAPPERMVLEGAEPFPVKGQ